MLNRINHTRSFLSLCSVSFCPAPSSSSFMLCSSYTYSLSSIPALPHSQSTRINSNAPERDNTLLCSLAEQTGQTQRQKSRESSRAQIVFIASGRVCLAAGQISVNTCKSSENTWNNSPKCGVVLSEVTNNRVYRENPLFSTKVR